MTSAALASARNLVCLGQGRRGLASVRRERSVGRRLRFSWSCLENKSANLASRLGSRLIMGRGFARESRSAVPETGTEIGRQGGSIAPRRRRFGEGREGPLGGACSLGRRD